MGTWANSEYLDEMPHNMAFPLGMQFAYKSVLVKADLQFDCVHTTKASLSSCLQFVIDFFYI